MIHKTAIIEPGAQIGANAEIGPYCHIGADVRLGDGAKLHSHVVLAGHTTIDENARIFPFASIGHEPQDLKFEGEMTTLTIGRNCLIREGVTMNPGTAGDAGETIIGDDCVFLANSHVAHDCFLGNRIIFSNGVLIAGHCKVDDNVIVGGGAGIHQFTHIGRNAFVGAMAGVDKDIIPYGIALGNRACLGGLNVVGMKRAGVPRESIHAARAAFKHIFAGDLPIAEAVDTLPEEIKQDEVVTQIRAFIKEGESRSLCTPRSRDDIA